MSKATTSAKVAALTAASALLLAACGGSSGGGDAGASGDAGAMEATAGGTLTFLTVDEEFNHLDPQRNYTGEDLAFAAGYLSRYCHGHGIRESLESGARLAAWVVQRHGTI